MIVAEPDFGAVERPDVPADRRGPGADEPHLVPQRLQLFPQFVEIVRGVLPRCAGQRLSRAPVRLPDAGREGVEPVVGRPPSFRALSKAAQLPRGLFP